jgi:hypothetical protein
MLPKVIISFDGEGRLTIEAHELDEVRLVYMLSKALQMALNQPQPAPASPILQARAVPPAIQQRLNGQR